MQLVIEKVGKQYQGGLWALRDFSLELAPGILGLLGPNGAGKSTLMKILATITRPTEGRVTWEGTDVHARPDALRAALGYLPQGSGVGARLALSGDLHGLATWGAAVLFIPALALALGLISRGNRLFEVIYTVLWHIGPLNRVSALDFMGASSPGQPVTWLVATALALALAFGVRARQLRG